jgi:hypothetical protein
MNFRDYIHQACCPHPPERREHVMDVITPMRQKGTRIEKCLRCGKELRTTKKDWRFLYYELAMPTNEYQPSM